MNTQNSLSKRVSVVWIGLAKVKPRPGGDTLGEDVPGAFVNVLAMADSEAALEIQAREALATLGLDLVEIDECEPLEKRRAEWEVDDEILQKAGEVESTGYLRFSTFHTYLHEDK